MTTAAKRARQKGRREVARKHSGADHVPGERCLVCKPEPLTPEQRLAAKVQDETRRIELAERAGGSLLTVARRAVLQMSAGRIVPRSVPVRRRDGRRGS